MLDAVKRFFFEDVKAGCRFLTLDAYPDKVGFYKKNQFREMQLPEDAEKRDTVPMFYDLKELSEINSQSKA